MKAMTWPAVVLCIALYGCATSLPQEPVQPTFGFEQTLRQIDQMRPERQRWPISYLTRAVGVVGAYDKVLTSPRMLAPSARSEADTALQMLRLEFPQSGGSATDASLERLKSYAGRVLVTDAVFEDMLSRLKRDVTYQMARQAAEEKDRVALEMQLLIRRIQENLAGK